MEQQIEREPVLKNKIRLDIIFNTLRKEWRKFIVPIVSSVVISSLLAICIPRYYTVKVLLAPEYNEGGGNMGGLGGLASMVGINLGSMTGADAISPTFYPDLMASTDFLVPLMRTQVTTKDSSFTGTYVSYLTQKQQFPWWQVARAKFISLFKEKKAPLNTNKDYRPNPFALTKTESDLVMAIAGSISCSVDKKTEVITIVTKAQDPLVAALLADTVKQRLQDFIIDYRTNKARNDLKHISQLCEDSRQNYECAQREYAEFVDSHRDIALESYRVIENKYSNDVELAHSAYNAVLQQKLLAEAKLQERIPAFTTLQNASVPVKHTGPKRMMGVLSITFLVFIITSIVIVVRRKE